jgi:hypothetical protein
MRGEWLNTVAGYIDMARWTYLILILLLIPTVSADTDIWSAMIQYVGSEGPYTDGTGYTLGSLINGSFINATATTIKIQVKGNAIGLTKLAICKRSTNMDCQAGTWGTVYFSGWRNITGAAAGVTTSDSLVYTVTAGQDYIIKFKMTASANIFKAAGDATSSIGCYCAVLNQVFVDEGDTCVAWTCAGDYSIYLSYGIISVGTVSSYNLTLKAYDSTTGIPLTNFSAVVNGTSYSTTNGTITTSDTSTGTTYGAIKQQDTITP